jgi:hypothetical protein
MAVGLSLVGKFPPPDGRLTLNDARDWMARAAAWFEAAGDAVLDTHPHREADDRPALRVTLHPAAEDVDLRLSPAGKVKVTARTSPAGPGYHAHLCGLLRQFAADFDFTWDDPPADADPARYFATGDRERLERHFLHWLASACSAALQASTPDGRYQIGMPRQPRFRHPGPVLTPTGPRPLGWLKRVAADGTAGADFFPWWGPDLDAAFYRGRAVTHLWLEFRGRPPLTDAEGELVDQIAADLANAFDLDPTVELPYAAWAEVIAAIAGDRKGLTVEPVSAELKAEVEWRASGPTPSDPLGYRRHDVEVPLAGGWYVTVPGRFACEWSDGGKTWTAWEDGRTVWFQERSLGHPDGPVPSAAAAVAAGRKSLPAGERLAPRSGSVVGEAVWGPHAENGRPVWRLCGVAASAGRLAACNVYAANEADRAWAEATWQSLTHG